MLRKLKIRVKAPHRASGIENFSYHAYAQVIAVSYCLPPPFLLFSPPPAFASTPEKETAIDYFVCAGKLRNSNPEEDVRKAAKGIALAKKACHPIERAKCLTAMSSNLILLQKSDTARLVLEQALI